MTDLAALIEKLEKATEGSDELDYDIARAIDPAGSVGFRCVGDERAVWYRSQEAKIDCPHFTTSLDAALTLVPHEFEWSVRNHWKDVGVSATVYAANGIGESVHGNTPTLALCIAALKARAS